MSALCLCGCQLPAREGSKYASNACRTRYFDSLHPRLDLSGLEVEARKRAERLVAEAVRAAKEGCERATVDARHDVRHEKDERPSRRVRLDAETWEMLDQLTEDDDGWALGLSRSEVVKIQVRTAWRARFDKRRSA